MSVPVVSRSDAAYAEENGAHCLMVERGQVGTTVSKTQAGSGITRLGT